MTCLVVSSEDLFMVKHIPTRQDLLLELLLHVPEHVFQLKMYFLCEEA